jgi:hypothetical protein
MDPGTAPTPAQNTIGEVFVTSAGELYLVLILAFLVAEVVVFTTVATLVAIWNTIAKSSH